MRHAEAKNLAPYWNLTPRRCPISNFSEFEVIQGVKGKSEALAARAVARARVSSTRAYARVHVCVRARTHVREDR